MTNGVAQYKDQGAEYKGQNYPPSSQEAVEYSPKEELLCYRTYNPANDEKKDQIHGPRR